MKVLVFVALRENAVLLMIEKMQQEGAKITYEAIASRLGCHYATVQRATANLKKSGLIDCKGNPFDGYTYTILERTG